MRYPDGRGLTVGGAGPARAGAVPGRLDGRGRVGAAQVARALRVSRRSAYTWHAAWLRRHGGVTVQGALGGDIEDEAAWRTWLTCALEQGPAAHGGVRTSAGRWRGLR